MDPDAKGVRPESLVGSRISHVARVLFLYRGRFDQEDGALELGLGARTVLLDSAPEGDRLMLAEHPWLDPFREPLSDDNRRYVEEHGAWRRVDCSSDDRLSSLVGQTIGECRALLNRFGDVAGLRITTPASSLWFIVEGDESHVRWSPPAAWSEAEPGP